MNQAFRALTGAALLAAWLLAPALSGCDDLSKPLPKTMVAEPRETAKPGATQVIDWRGKVMPKEELKSLYTYIVTTRQDARRMLEEFNQTKERGGEDYRLIASNYRTQNSQWTRMVEIRIEWLDTSVRPDSAVAAPNLLLRAMRELRRELYHIANYMSGQDPYDPTIDQNLLTLLDQANFQLNKPDLRSAKPGVPLDGSTN